MSKLNDLKAEAYDLIAQMERHQVEIQEIQKKLNEKNAEIMKEMEAQSVIEAVPADN